MAVHRTRTAYEDQKEVPDQLSVHGLGRGGTRENGGRTPSEFLMPPEVRLFY